MCSTEVCWLMFAGRGLGIITGDLKLPATLLSKLACDRNEDGVLTGIFRIWEVYFIDPCSGPLQIWKDLRLVSGREVEPELLASMVTS